MFLESYVFCIPFFVFIQTELEAIAHSRLGLLYHKVLKNKIRAKEYLMTANGLAASLHPKMFYTEGIHACQCGIQELL